MLIKTDDLPVNWPNVWKSFQFPFKTFLRHVCIEAVFIAKMYQIYENLNIDVFTCKHCLRTWNGFLDSGKKCKRVTNREKLY